MRTLWWVCSMIFLLTCAVLQTVVYSVLGYSSIAKTSSAFRVLCSYSDCACSPESCLSVG